VKCEGDIIGRLDVNSVGEQVVQTEKVNFQHMKIGDMNMSIRGLFDGNSVLSKHKVVDYLISTQFKLLTNKAVRLLFVHRLRYSLFLEAF